MKGKSILFAAAAIFLVSACTKAQEEQPEEKTYTLEVDCDNLEFGPDNYTATIYVLTNADDWTYTESASWLEFEKDGKYLKVTATPNNSGVEKTAEISICTVPLQQDATKTIPVKLLPENGGGNPDDGEDNFSDPAFWDAVSGYDADGDGKLSADEALRITELDLDFDEEAEGAVTVKSLKGIRLCRNLTTLYCEYNAIRELDLSGLDKLEYVACGYNLIESINLKGCTSLKQLYFNVNKIKNLDISDCRGLVFLQGYKNELSSFALTDRSEIFYVQLDQNKLTSFSAKNCPKLGTINVGSNNLQSLTLENLPALHTLGCYRNSLTSLNVKSFPEMVMLECYQNNLTSLDLGGLDKLVKLDCSTNMISTLNLPELSDLRSLNIASNQLKGSFDCKSYPSLVSFDCSGNFISALNVGVENTALTSLICSSMSLTSLDTSAASALQILDCHQNGLTALDMSSNRKLQKLDCTANPLTRLVLPKGVRVELSVDNFDIVEYK